MGELLDNYDLWEQREMEREEALQKLPKCAECGEVYLKKFFKRSS